MLCLDSTPPPPPRLPPSHPEADLDGLSLFKAKVQFRSCALIGFLLGQFTFLFYPPERHRERISHTSQTCQTPRFKNTFHHWTQLCHHGRSHHRKVLTHISQGRSNLITSRGWCWERTWQSEKSLSQPEACELRPPLLWLAGRDVWTNGRWKHCSNHAAYK